MKWIYLFMIVAVIVSVSAEDEQLGIAQGDEQLYFNNLGDEQTNIFSLFPRVIAVEATTAEESAASSSRSSGGSGCLPGLVLKDGICVSVEKSLPFSTSPEDTPDEVGKAIETGGEQKTAALSTANEFSSGKEPSARSKSALVGRAFSSAFDVLSDYSIYWLATVITGTSVGLVVYVVRRRRSVAKNVDLLESWTMKMMVQYATPEQLQSMVNLQNYWTEEDLERVFDRINAQQSLQKKHLLTSQHTAVVKHFIAFQSHAGQRKNNIITHLVEKGLDKEVITALVKTYY